MKQYFWGIEKKIMPKSRKTRNRVISFVTAMTVLGVTSSATVKYAINEVHAVTKVPEAYGDLNGDGTVDVFDSIYARKSASTANASIDKKLYTEELQNFLLEKSDDFTPENVVVNGNVSNQKIPSNSVIFSEINTAESPYTLSADIKAAGWAEAFLNVTESPYANAMATSSMLGRPLEFSYSDGFAVESFTLKFKIADEYVDNILGTYSQNTDGFKGIKRLSVFKYFEDINMIIPIMTEYDAATNTVYTTVDGLGSYCLVDLEMWFDTLDAVSQQQEAYAKGLTVQKSIIDSADDYVTPTPVPVSPLVQGDSGLLAEVLASLMARHDEVSFGSGSVSIDYWTFANGKKYARFDMAVSQQEAKLFCTMMGGKLMTGDIKNATNKSQLQYILSFVAPPDSPLDYYFIDATYDPTKLGSRVETGWFTQSKTVEDASGFYSMGFDIGFICEWGKGDAIRNPIGTGQEVPVYLTGGENNVYLDAMPSATSNIDTDGDGLTDWEEIDIAFLKLLGKYNNGTITLPTMLECLETKNSLNYVTEWTAILDVTLINELKLKNYLADKVKALEALLNVKVLPIKSNPASKDSDGDGILDPNDVYPLTANRTKAKKKWRTSSNDYKHKLTVERNVKYDTTDYIYGQGSSIVKDMIYFGVSIKTNGCELIAIYNSAKLLGQQLKLSEIISEFMCNSRTQIILNGIFGTDPKAIYEYLEYHDYKYEYTESKSTFEKWAKKDRVFIISKWNDPITNGLHTMAIQCDGFDANGNPTYTVWNRFNNAIQKDPGLTLSQILDNGSFICGYYLPKV